MMNALVPTRIDEEIIDGAFIKALEFCKTNCGKGICKSFYDSISEKDCGKFLICPHGLSVYVLSNVENRKLFVSLRNKDAYEKEKAKRINNPPDVVSYNPLLDTDKLLQLIHYSDEIDKERVELEEQKAAFGRISHEAKELVSKVKEHAGVLLEEYDTDDGNIELSSRDRKGILDKIKTIYISGSIAYSRFALHNYEKNPQVLKQGAMYNGNIHGKFLKMVKIFSASTRCKNQLRIIGKTSHTCIRAYPSFELIPFLLIDNAVKYSYLDNDIEIVFTESDPDLLVKIISFGPLCTEAELQQVFQKGFRGENAVKASQQGSGIGLFFVKILCDLHNIDISAETEGPIANINSMEYAKFVVSLRFKNVYRP